jgi:hypothetical protein
LRKFALLTSLLSLFLLPNLAAAQQGDAMLGFGTVMSPGANACGIYSSGFQCPEKGGLYPNISADVIFHRRMGIAFDVAWRGSQGNYGNLGIPYRPILFDFNGVYQPKLGPKTGLDLMAGIGWQSTRFYGYTPTFNCQFYGACYTSSNHFLVDLGGGIRYYFWHHVFIRPEAHYYWINNNTADFTSGNVLRVGASIGYTIGPD